LYPDCNDINRLVTPYVDGEMPGPDRMAVEAHLAVCPVCRHRAMVEREARNAVRSQAKSLCGCASARLQERCRRAATLQSSFGTTRLRAFPMAMAAAAVLIVGGVAVYALTASSTTVLAAQLALDHVKCFALFGGQQPIEPTVAEETLTRDYGWALKLPAEVAAAGLQLVGARRCLYGEGALAHVMYRLQGKPLSLFMLPDTVRSGGMAGALGHDAVMWSASGRTFVLVGREPRVELEKIAAYFERADQP
jgi:anti-sigma factor RsiW